MIKALIVEDEEEIGILLKRILKKIDIEADHATRLEIAKKYIQKNSYDVYLLDLNLPDGSGFDLAATIRQSDPLSNFIIISAYDSFLERNKAREHGAFRFIKKPFGKDEIVGAIEEIKTKL